MVKVFLGKRWSGLRGSTLVFTFSSPTSLVAVDPPSTSPRLRLTSNLRPLPQVLRLPRGWFSMLYKYLSLSTPKSKKVTPMSSPTVLPNHPTHDKISFFTSRHLRRRLEAHRGQK